MEPRERLQPSLLDRLTDDAPGARREPAERRSLTETQLRDVLKRDLAWLLNTTNLGSLQDLSAYPEVRRSVLNFGVPDLTGRAVLSLRADTVRDAIRQAILDFEPRIIPASLAVRVIVSEQMSHNALRFEIEAEFSAEPVPLHMLLESELDLENGHVFVQDPGPGRRR